MPKFQVAISTTRQESNYQMEDTQTQQVPEEPIKGVLASAKGFWHLGNNKTAKAVSTPALETASLILAASAPIHLAAVSVSADCSGLKLLPVSCHTLFGVSAVKSKSDC